MKIIFKYTVIFFCAFVIAGLSGYLGVSLFTKSAPEIILPDLVGKNIIQVLETLTRLGLNPKLHATRYHESIPKYGVIFQDPQPGATIKKGRDVVIYLSKGFKDSLIPNIRHRPLKQGLISLEENELAQGRIVYVYSETHSKNTIISQYPLAQEKVAANTSCDLLVSKGPKPLARVMPDLENVSLAEAQKRIDDAGLVLTEIRTRLDAHRPRGQVVQQTPMFGTRVMPGNNIILTVNESGTHRIMDPSVLNQAVWISYQLPPGFTNRHVRVTIDFFGNNTDLINQYMKPEKNINLLIPGGIKTNIRIFVDRKLKKIWQIDPWQKANTLPWTYLPQNAYTGELLWQ